MGMNLGSLLFGKSIALNLLQNICTRGELNRLNLFEHLIQLIETQIRTYIKVTCLYKLVIEKDKQEGRQFERLT